MVNTTYQKVKDKNTKMKKIGESIYNLLDFVLAIVSLVILSPFFVIASLLVKFNSPGPIFYTQERYGKDKKKFIIFKFRTMDVDTEKGTPVWGTESDPRSDRIGRFLRISNIDELPQLFNVLKGQMSLVGPRPERPYFSEKFKLTIPNYEERYKVKPGLTGWSQINGLRGDSSVEERAKYDIFYINNRSLFFYLKIILFTPLKKPVKTLRLDDTNLVYQRDFSQVDEVFAETAP